MGDKSPKSKNKSKKQDVKRKAGDQVRHDEKQAGPAPAIAGRPGRSGK